MQITIDVVFGVSENTRMFNWKEWKICAVHLGTEHYITISIKGDKCSN